MTKEKIFNILSTALKAVASDDSISKDDIISAMEQYNCTEELSDFIWLFNGSMFFDGYDRMNGSDL